MAVLHATATETGCFSLSKIICYLRSSSVRFSLALPGRLSILRYEDAMISSSRTAPLDIPIKPSHSI